MFCVDLQGHHIKWSIWEMMTSSQICVFPLSALSWNKTKNGGLSLHSVSSLLIIAEASAVHNTTRLALASIFQTVMRNARTTFASLVSWVSCHPYVEWESLAMRSSLGVLRKVACTLHYLSNTGRLHGPLLPFETVSQTLHAGLLSDSVSTFPTKPTVH